MLNDFFRKLDVLIAESVTQHLSPWSEYTLYKKWSFPLRISSVIDLVTFTVEIHNEIFIFVCSDRVLISL